MAICIAILLLANRVTHFLSLRLAALPIEGIQHTIKPIPISSNTKIFPLLAEIHANATVLNKTNLEMAFTRELAPVATATVTTTEQPLEPFIAPVSQPAKPSAANIFKQQARLTAIAAQGAFINGRYYQVGEAINSVARLVSVYDCSARVSVGTEQKTMESVDLIGKCK
jgi:hypothetical protein